MVEYRNTSAVISFVPMTCPVAECGVVYALSERYQSKRREDGGDFHCPNGHQLSYRNAIKSDTAELRDAKAREVALRDQLEASARDAEAVRGALLRDRHRFANGVCPCCNRSFDNVRRHMSTQHPDYDATKVAAAEATVQFTCTCGRAFKTLPGLHRHQTASRSGDWYKANNYAWRAHLTKV